VATAHSVTEERNRQRLTATELERARWARELHDETMQGFAYLRLLLDSARGAVTAEELDGKLARAVEQIDSELATLRALVTELRPVVLDDLGPEAAILTLADRFGQHGLEVVASIDLAYERGRHPLRHSVELETAIYRIVQQALTNARQHGAATHATVDIVEDEANVRVVVRDDGSGFDMATGGQGYGLVSMRERTQLLHGSLVVDSAPGEGTTITATLRAVRRPDGEQTHH
jgi:signal transduction histidine kinase